MTRGNNLDVREEELSLGARAPLQIGGDRCGSNRTLGELENFYLGSEPQAVAILSVIKGLDAEPVAGHEKLRARCVVNGKCEHAFDSVQQSMPPASVGLQKCF